MRNVPRHAFVREADMASAYANQPLPIGHGQTISQPYIVALMTDLLDIGPGERVLEVGTGCGYQTAILAEIAEHVFSVEVVPKLATSARRRLGGLGYANVTVVQGDGCFGLPKSAPFDAIIVTAAPTRIPEALVAQLKTGGRLVIPVGLPGETQYLYRCVLRGDGDLESHNLLPVAFVPLISGPT